MYHIFIKKKGITTQKSCKNACNKQQKSHRLPDHCIKLPDLTFLWTVRDYLNKYAGIPFPNDRVATPGHWWLVQGACSWLCMSPVLAGLWGRGQPACLTGAMAWYRFLTAVCNTCCNSSSSHLTSCKNQINPDLVTISYKTNRNWQKLWQLSKPCRHN